MLIAGATTTIGDVDNPAASPTFELALAAFALDVDLVSVERFAAFVAQTGHVSTAAQRGGATVFDLETRSLTRREGADWLHPAGPAGRPANARHPVAHVSHTDATAFCAWAQGRLPTEFEWEFAARNAGTRPPTRYPWGDNVFDDGRFRANTWQGIYPIRNTIQDGYLATSPVGAFGPSPLGLHDMVGNVWQWTSSPHTEYPPAALDAADADSPFTIRGGSFLCEPSVCDGAITTARHAADPGEVRADLGFRCAYDVADSDGSR